ncbi:AT hook domain-containing protein [Plectosphaerella plurivora]|uniref:AT hook domain-containing protein n=1 Tax=Plectosphaerella plurivora TaxID=936078 RepID=A0A9P9A8Z1_9PEZI|nr:AT hook domain-containing protein [Plectosphaerella plurivora]
MRIRIMVPRRIIADSDDEDDGNSPNVSPRKPPPQAGPHLGSSSSDALANTTSSTDSRFFASVYHQQAAGIPSHQVPIEEPSQDPLADHLSPVPEPTYPYPDDIPGTEPVPTPTQVATPGNVRRGMASRDIWDVPSSGEQAGNTTMEHSTDNDRPTKRRKTVQMASSGPSEITPGTRGPALLGPSSLCIDPQTLSPSRRMLYQSIQPSSDDQTQTQPHTDPITGPMDRSSGSATIAYPTPTQARNFVAPATDSIPEEPYLAEEPLAEEPQLIPLPDVAEELQSSPDIIVTHKTSRARRAAEQSFDEICEPDDGELPQEQYKPRPSRRRAPAESTESQRQAAALFDPGPDSLPPQKRRGRPRKSKESAGESEDKVGGEGKSGKATASGLGVEDAGPLAPAEAGPVSIDVAEQAEFDVQPMAPAKEKRKRGRPRKADKVPPADAGTEDTKLSDSKDQVREESAGRGATHEGSRPETPLEEEAKADVEVEDTDQAEEKAPPKAGHVVKEASPATPAPGPAPAQAKGPARGVPTTPASGGKPVYRVGLSKRSRIAPLLKSLRKT